jgi:transcriptional/translational regulatory protein YebC/TACO1
MGASGSVAFQFTRMGVFRIKPEDVGDPEELELEMIDHGLEEMGEGQNDDGEPVWVLRCDFDSFGSLQEGLEAAKIKVSSTALEHVPGTFIELPDPEAEEVMKLIARLENDEDVSQVFHNLV